MQESIHLKKKLYLAYLQTPRKFGNLSLALFERSLTRLPYTIATQYQGMTTALSVCNRPYHGFRRHFDVEANGREITVFVWKCDVK